MKIEDFAKIFYSNFTPQTDWYNLEEIHLMYEEGMIDFTNDQIATNPEFIEKIDYVATPKNGFIRVGENYAHLALKSLGAEYLHKRYKVKREDVLFEQWLTGFEVDVIDKKMLYPTECGDTNALKLEKYLELASTKEFMVIPYPHHGPVLIFHFIAKPMFFEYLKFKKADLKKSITKLR